MRGAGSRPTTPGSDHADTNPAPGGAAYAVHQRARRGIRLMLSRGALVLLLTFGSGIILARTLAPADFGVFAIALFIVIFVGLLTDLGLRPALIQRPGMLAERDFTTAFTIQQAAVTAAVGLLWSGAAWLPTLYPKAPAELVWLVRLMAMELYLVSWRDMSEVLLERTLRYERLARIDVVGSLVYNGVALALALGGQGVWSLGYAKVASSLTRAVLVHRAAPWPIRLAFDGRAARTLLGAGLPLQIGRIVTQAQYWVTPTLVAGAIGPDAAGLLQWAAGNGRKPLEFLENVVRVSLPHFSMLQHDRAEVERTLSRYVLVFVLVCGLWLAVLAVAGRDLVTLVYTVRWVAAVPPMVLFAGVGLLVSVRVIVTTALVGLGQMGFTARVSAVGALATLGASVGLVLALGFIGVALGQLVGAAVALPWLVSGLGAGAIARVLVPAGMVLLPMGAACAVGIVTHLAPLEPAVRGLLTAGIMTLAYGATAWWVAPAWLREAAWHELAPTRGFLKRPAR